MTAGGHACEGKLRILADRMTTCLAQVTGQSETPNGRDLVRPLPSDQRSDFADIVPRKSDVALLAEAPAVCGPLPLAARCLLGPGRRGCNHLREGAALPNKIPTTQQKLKQPSYSVLKN